ncbi:PilZ domain-containing protein [Croceicoccus hydrothermalis]|uniref:PilZ domain-containing protein n=1 Tax=Croceicoccus hydrothermalis TaxID=2867964 RepID=UPI001EFA4B79|nr:PilZ domain-containing protein [Croceicoccus hydrothermalis]
MTQGDSTQMTAKGVNSRRHERESLFLVTEVRLERDGAPYRVKLRNISDAGTLAEGAMRVTRGQAIWVTLPRIGWVAGQVAWSAGDRCGIAFDTEIDSSLVQFPIGESEPAPREGALGNVSPS